MESRRVFSWLNWFDIYLGSLINYTCELKNAGVCLGLFLFTCLDVFLHEFFFLLATLYCCQSAKACRPTAFFGKGRKNRKTITPPRREVAEFGCEFPSQDASQWKIKAFHQGNPSCPPQSYPPPRHKGLIRPY